MLKEIEDDHCHRIKVIMLREKYCQRPIQSSFGTFCNLKVFANPLFVRTALMKTIIFQRSHHKWT